jgi:nucleotide-binding universal stress UspA family protein
MIAWDGGKEALRAARRAFPLMSSTTEVEIVTVDASDWQAASAEDLAQMLSRHDLSVSIHNAVARDSSDAETLAQRQLETGADLTVMGGYAHSRFREAVFGGVTEDLPSVSHTPLLMAH